MAATTRKSRVFTISLPEEMAEKARAIAAQESFTMSELFRQAFRTYLEREFDRALEAAQKYAKSHNPFGYNEQDVTRLVKEVRAEIHAERLAKERAEQTLAAK